MRPASFDDHILFLGWNRCAQHAYVKLREHEPAPDLVVLVRPDTHIPAPPGSHSVRDPRDVAVLRAVDIDRARAVLVFPDDEADPSSDHTTIITTRAVRRLNPTTFIAAQLVSPDHRDLFDHAGCDALLDPGTLVSDVMVAGLGAPSSLLVGALLAAPERGGLRIEPTERFVGRRWVDVAKTLLSEGRTLLAVARAGDVLVGVHPDIEIRPDDRLYVLGTP
ncbi:MAG: NAD-binding protein [Myxococcales bacterium]|nr:NAD-binding protein [Myxococcales bacterium]